MSSSIKIFLVIFISLFVCKEAHSQWPRGTGKGYVQVSYGTATANKQFNSNRGIQQLGGADGPQEYSENAIYLYSELGLSDDFTLIASTFYKDITIQTLDGTLDTRGLSDLTLQLRYTAYNSSSLVISPEIGVRIPTGYSTSEPPFLGSGHADLILSVNTGLSLYPVPGYFGASIGSRLRGGSQQDEITGHFEAGYFVHPKVLLRGRFDGSESTTNSNNSEFSVTSRQLSEQAFYIAGPGITYLLSDKLQLSIDGRWTVAGRTASQLTNYLFGVAITW